MADKALWERRALALQEKLQEAGLAAEINHYPPSPVDELDRWYVLHKVDDGAIQYEVQYNQRRPEAGTSWSSRRFTAEPDESLRDRIEALRLQVAKEVF